ncbi:MAG: SDR family oxidoreductase [Oscillospiraceae bacterium]|nr:SDR family oxidoreductase [Oscillospiraceae bacterium]
MGRLDNKVAIITGAASGMGAAQARLFAKEGAKIVGMDLNEEGLNQLISDIKAAGGEGIAVKANIAVEEDCQKAVKAAVEAFGCVNILVNTAGVAGPFSSKAHEHDADAWDKLLGINLKGAFLVSKHVIPEMQKAGGGSIINISSIGALIGGQGGTGYSAAKAGLRGLSKSIAFDYAKDNIRSNTIFPGQIKTPLSASLEAPEAAELKQYYINKIPMGRFGDPDDIAYAALYYASDESKYTTGSELVVDGGVMSN